MRNGIRGEAEILSFPERGDVRAHLMNALADLAGHLEQVLSSLGQGIALLDGAAILPKIRQELAAAAGRASDLADWLEVVRRQMPDLPPDRLNAAVAPLVVELVCLDNQANAILGTLPGLIRAMPRHR